MADDLESRLLERIEDLGVKSLVNFLFAILALLLVLTIIALLPGVDRLVPGLQITFGAIISAVVTLAVVLLLIVVARRARAFILQLRTGSLEVEVEMASLIYWMIIFLAVVFAYEGFRDAIEPVLAEAGLVWTYDLAFFLLGLGPLMIVGYHLFQLLDPLADACVEKLHPDSSPNDTSSAQSVPSGETVDDTGDS